jgi:hypothetical protein
MQTSSGLRSTVPNTYSCGNKGVACQHNDWGMENKENHMHHPSKTGVLGVENVLMATVVPAQVLLSNQTSVTAANECQDSAAARRKNENEIF